MTSFLKAWTWKMAWRDARSNKKRLFVYISAIIIGVAAQVAITSFRDSLNNTIDNQAKELLGADLEIEKNNAAFTEEEWAYFDSLGGETSTMVEFSSMVLLTGSGGTRLSEIRALEGDFPYYGELVTTPEDAVTKYREQKMALVDNTLLLQYGDQPGDSIKIGDATFEIAGAIEKIPGEAAAASMIGPRIFIPRSMLDSTNLIQRGSRIEYKVYFKFEESRDMAALEENLRPFAREHNLGFDTVEERKEEIGEVTENLARFLNLVGFIALLLGGIGVASSIHVYIKQKIDTASVLRCFGASSNQTMNIFLIQALVLGFIGALAGTILGVGIQFMLPSLVTEFLPLEVTLTISWFSVAVGIFTGTGVALVFALLPLLSIRKVSPLYALRSIDHELTHLLGKKVKFGIYGMIALTVASYASLITQSWLAGFLFAVGIAVALALLMFVAKGLMWLVRNYFPIGWAYVWRQGLANLYRPNNQTTTLLVTLGLGMLLISTLYFSQDMLLGQLEFASRENSPNLIFYDIQSDQNEGVIDVIRENDMPLVQNVPVVSMKIDSINGRSTEEIEQDTSRKARRWALKRTYRSTYRDSLIDSEVLIEGEWTGKVKYTGNPVPISAAQDITEDLNIGLGDTLTFDVQGVPIKTYVGSIRKVNFRGVQPNFFILFPSGVLEEAPQFFVTVTKVPNRETSALLQREVVKEFPNVSAIDVTLILDTINTFIDRISFGIQFIALFSILTGLIVLAGSIATTRYQRMKESVLLRTLGASKKQIIKILTVEYLLLGFLGALTGLILSAGSTWLLGYFYFDLTFIPNIWVITIGTVAIMTLTIVIGMLNSRSVYRKPPLEVLRLETA